MNPYPHYMHLQFHIANLEPNFNNGFLLEMLSPP